MSTHLVVRNRGHELGGVVREGESWRDAARRTCASMHADPAPFDLSGEIKQFVVDHDLTVAVRPMTRDDLPDVARWRGASHVRRWWADTEPPSLAGVTEAYGRRIDGASATRMWVVEANGRSVGFVQDYLIADYPHVGVLSPDPKAIGVDYCIGETSALGRGIAARGLWCLLDRLTHRHPGARTVIAAPDHRNAASLRMLDKVGFVRGTWFDEPRRDGGVATMVGCTLDLPRVVG